MQQIKVCLPTQALKIPIAKLRGGRKSSSFTSSSCHVKGKARPGHTSNITDVYSMHNNSAVNSCVPCSKSNNSSYSVLAKVLGMNSKTENETLARHSVSSSQSCSLPIASSQMVRGRAIQIQTSFVNSKTSDSQKHVGVCSARSMSRSNINTNHGEKVSLSSKVLSPLNTNHHVSSSSNGWQCSSSGGMHPNVSCTTSNTFCSKSRSHSQSTGNFPASNNQVLPDKAMFESNVFNVTNSTNNELFSFLTKKSENAMKTFPINIESDEKKTLPNDASVITSFPSTHGCHISSKSKNCYNEKNSPIVSLSYSPTASCKNSNKHKIFLNYENMNERVHEVSDPVLIDSDFCDSLVNLSGSSPVKSKSEEKQLSNPTKSMKHSSVNVVTTIQTNADCKMNSETSDSTTINTDLHSNYDSSHKRSSPINLGFLKGLTFISELDKSKLESDMKDDKKDTLNNSILDDKISISSYNSTNKNSFENLANASCSDSSGKITEMNTNNIIPGCISGGTDLQGAQADNRNKTLGDEINFSNMSFDYCSNKMNNNKGLIDFEKKSSNKDSNDTISDLEEIHKNSVDSSCYHDINNDSRNIDKDEPIRNDKNLPITSK